MMRFIIRKFNIYTPVITTITVLISLFSFTSNLIGQTTQTFTSSGAFSVPDRVIEITVQCWGAGGAGGGSSTSSYGGSGGGGGAYSTGTISVVPNQSISYTVGIGGSGSTGNGTAGGSSSFSNLTANGGGGGGADSGTRGAGGTASGGSTNTTGGNGVTGGTSGGKGGDGANGGTGGSGSTDNDGVAGNFPGGGGGGGEASGYWFWTTPKSGGAGANGQIIITYSTVNVVVSASSGNTSGYYKTLKNAFDKINDGTHKGNISITIYGNLTESSTALLNASGTGSASYNNVNIYPVVSGVTISGSIDGPLIKLDGADNVTIDGRVNAMGSSTDLIISNTNAGTSSVTVNFENSAQNNTLQYCTVRGGGGSNANGTIVLGTSGININNKVDNCNVTNNGTRRSRCIFSTAGTGLTISNNNLYDNWSNTIECSSVYLGGSVTESSVLNNSIYQTSAFTQGVYNYYGIYISNTSGNNFNVSGNYFGGRAPLCGGTTFTMSTANSYLCPIYLNVGTTSASSVQGNTIANVAYTSSNSQPFNGIYVAAGNVNIGTTTKNTIGNITGTGSVTLTSSITTATSYGINNQSSGTVIITQNEIGSVSTSNSSTQGHSFAAIYNNGTGLCTISNNIIGSTAVTGSIRGQSASTANIQFIYGVLSNNTGTVNINNNTIFNLLNNTTRNDVANSCSGIVLSGSKTNTVTGNFISDIDCSSTGANNYVAGLYSDSYGGTLTAYNNIIYLGRNLDGKNYLIHGIYNKSGAAENFYHNTVYISGTAGTSSLLSSAFRKGGWSTSLVVKNNIFVNIRTGGSSAKHPAIAINATGITSDNNDFYSATITGTVSDSYTPYTSLGDWQIATSTDLNSISFDPVFSSAGSTTTSGYFPGIDLLGEDLTSLVPVDIAGTTRTSFATMGAWERPLSYNVEVYNGTTYLNHYLNLKGAFDAINNGTHSGSLTIKVTGSIIEKNQPILNSTGTSSGGGTSNYSSINIYPTVSGINVSGSFNGTLISLNGADNITIDGRVGATGTTTDLTIINSRSSENSVTLGFDNTSQNNTIKYCNVYGGGGSATNGTILFGTTGNNSSNNINNCNITNNGTRRVNAIYSAVGTNTGNIISSNNIYNTWKTDATSYFINFGAGVSGCEISGNSFYETSTFNPGGSYSYYGVNIDNTLGSGFNIANNYFGGQSALCGGSAMNVTPSATYHSCYYYPFYFNVGTSSVTSVQGNTIKNLSFSSYNTGNPLFYGFHINAGTINLGTVSGNIIGDETTTGSVTITGNVYNASSYGIYVAGSGNVQISNNKIGSVTLANTNTANAHFFYGIYKTSTTGSLTIINNTIGSTVSNSVQTSSVATSNSQSLYGIYTLGTGSTVITGNYVNNLYNASTRNDATNSVYGIYYDGSSSATVEKNYIYNLRVGSTGTANIISGMSLISGSTNCINNVINLGSGTTSYNLIYGIFETGVNGQSDNFYHNTVYLSGTVSGTASAAKTYCFYKANNTGSTDIRNNIFFNARSAGKSSSRHYTISLPGISNISIDYNDYYITGTYGYIGYLGSDRQTFNNWKTATSQDAGSFNVNPSFSNAGGSVATDYKSGNSTLIGVNVSVTTDFSGSNRSSDPSIGAFENPSSTAVEIYKNDILQSSYRTLKSAFSAINNGLFTGSLKILINYSTNETSTAVLYASGTGSASYSRIIIYPTGPDISVSGNLNGPLVNFQGADNVFLNGSVYQTNTTPGLTISNTNTGTAASTVCFSESAQNNRVSYCIIKGSGLGTDKGIVYYSTSTSGTGNDNDTISYCDITASASGRPINAVYSSGTSGRENDNNLIANNSVFDFLNLANNSNGVLIDGNSNNFTISGNSFYGTSTFSPTSSSTYNIIDINNTSGGGYVISGNYIGGSSALCAGTLVKSGNNNTFNAILINAGSTVATGIHGNIIKNISFTNTANADFKAINISSGLVNIGTAGGNIIGETTGNGSISLINATTGGAFYGIYVSSYDNVDCQSNLFGSVTTTNTSSDYSNSFYGIYKSAVGGNLNISGNTIGSVTTENSLYASSLANSNIQHVYGIYSAGTGQTTINSNEIANLTNATTSTQYSFTRGVMTIDGSNTITNNTIHHLKTSSSQGENYTNVSIVGIFQVSETANTVQTITGNKIFELTNTSTSKIELYGIFYKGPTTGDVTTHQISRNFVHTFNIVSTSDAYLHGISMYAGTYTLSNNIVYLGNNITTGCSIWGLWNYSSSPLRIFHNTSYLTGVASAGTSFSYAMRDLSANATDRKIKNNIFWDERVVQGTVYPHYAIYLQNTNNLELDYNDYQFTQYIGRVNNTNYESLSQWQSGTGKDLHTIILNPQLTNLGGILPSDYQPNVTGLSGTPLSEIPTDFGFMERSTTAPTMGAWEYFSNPVEIWNGATYRNSYPTLKGAFDVINNGTYKGESGDLIIKIRGNTIETATATLYYSGYNSTSNYSKLLIYPARSNIQVKGSLSAPLVDLNGADNVIFDGRLNGTGSMYELMLLNEDRSTGASTIKFTNSAENNTIRYCKVQGLTTATSGGIVHFSTSSTGNGNDNNCILQNKISIVDNNDNYRVINAIYSEGSSGIENNTDSIKNNEIYDTWSRGASSNSINLASYSSGFVISGNSIYETTDFTPTSGNTYQAIRINNTSGTGFNIVGNYIGGKALQCKGSAMSMGISSSQSLVFQPIYLNVGSSTASSVQGNTVQNITMNSTYASPFSAIYINAGVSNIGTSSGNMIGNSIGTGSISITGSSVNAKSYGVFINSTDETTITGNNIGSITTVSNPTTYGHDFYGVYKAAVAGLLTVVNNVIGSSSTSGSINTSSVSSNNDQALCGIYTLGTGITNIRNNTVANLLNSSTRNNQNNSVAGICLNGANSNVNTIEQNFVYGLYCSNTATASAANMLAGIFINSGNATLVNNIICLGEGISALFKIYGIYITGNASYMNNIYHNTVYISGTATNTFTNTAAFYKLNAVGQTNLKNNILFNARSGGATGYHYAIYLPGNTNLTINGNDYFVNGASRAMLGYLTTTRSSITAWRTATGQDLNSISTNPNFVSAGSTVAANYYPGLGVNLLGLSGTGVTVDYGNYPRSSSSPTMGAWERSNKWKGTTSIDWNTASNWTGNTVPAVDDNIIFDDAPVRPCYMDQDRYVTDIINAQSAFRMINNGHNLNIKGNLVFSNGAQIDASATGSTVTFNGSTAQAIPSGAFYNDKVYNLTINNSNNVTLNGTVRLLNTLTATSGLLDATTSGATMIYEGTSEQTIASSQYLNNQAYNITANNSAGVVVNTNFTVLNNAAINSGDKLTIPENIGLTVNGAMTNSAGNAGLLLKSSISGTASLIHNSNGVAATVQRYVSGYDTVWHFLAPPVSGQPIHGTSWTPSGNYGDGTGYDMYVWDEPTSCWVYNLNTTASPSWTSIHPVDNFIPGRGYLYALLNPGVTNTFAGSLNNGIVNQTLTTSSDSVQLKGFNFIGNPYPSSIDWSVNAGFTRSMLKLDGGGYDMWIWSGSMNNYLVYNSADAAGTALIAPMQGFFVYASTGGTFAFNNAARVHTGASNWLKSAPSGSSGKIKLIVNAPDKKGSDEIQMRFGYTGNDEGAYKLFSNVKTAPSLFIPYYNRNYAVRRLTTAEDNKKTPLSFRAGVDGKYSITCQFDPAITDRIFLEDKITGTIHDFSQSDTYSFMAKPGDLQSRFAIHLGEIVPEDNIDLFAVYARAGVLYVDLSNLNDEYEVAVYDLGGKAIHKAKVFGGDVEEVSLSTRGIYMVSLRSQKSSVTKKVVY